VFALENQSFWPGDIDPISVLGVPSQAWTVRGDNFLSPIAFFVLFTTLTSVGYAHSYGGDFRESVLKNFGLNFGYAIVCLVLGWMMFSTPNRGNCVLRINCDTEWSLKAGGDDESWSIWRVARFWTAAGLGDCFIGTQILTWQTQWNDFRAENNIAERLVDGAKVVPVIGEVEVEQVSLNFLPDKKFGQCYPFVLKDLTYETTTGGNTTGATAAFSAEDSEEIGNGCKGPNNCWTWSFKWTVFACVMGNIIAQHLYVKFVLQGPVSRRFRTKDAEVELAELQQARTPLIP